MISSIAETYPYTIVSISDCSQYSQTEMLNEFYRLSKNKQLKILLSIMRKRFNSQHEYYNLIASYINFKYDTVKKCYIKINT